MNFVLVSSKSWHDSMFLNLQKRIGGKWTRITSTEKFTYKKIKIINPDIVFIPHWSHLISKEIFENFKCVVFHMTDLPYGRGGSPLQNLIERGHKQTMISAIKVEEGIDAGDVYLKAPLNLEGSAEEIFIRSSKVIQKMIIDIIKTDPIPQKQEGDVVVFRRRNPKQSNIANLKSIGQVYDFIRMLDCEGYPNAFIELENFKVEFCSAKLNDNESITAHVKITGK